jgi:hypothetical protein
MARRAVDDLDRLIATHSLPAATRQRVGQILRGLATFPDLGGELGGRWSEHRVLLGPWRWMLLIYRVDPEHDRVVVVTVQDARSSRAASSER